MSDVSMPLRGFASALSSEALAGAVPELQNSPRVAPYGLFPEQINGTPFTVPRARNRRTWMYRIRPSVVHSELEMLAPGRFGTGYLGQAVDPNLVAWRPRPLPENAEVDFAAGLETVGGAGDPACGPGLALHTYVATVDMQDVALSNHDGDMMVVPDTGALRVQTEFGWLRVEPGEIALIGRGMPMRVELENPPARGLVMEVFHRHFELPERGLIGANGLADERHFRVPAASYEDRAVPEGFVLLVKQGGRLWRAHRSHSPFDVVGWHGNYYPNVYDLAAFSGIGTVTWDHPDPSIFIALSAPLHHPGVHLADLAVFPNPRWDVAEHTFRPPFYHRQAATEINAIVKGPSVSDQVFTRGGLFITPPFAAHGVAVATVERQLALTDEEADRPQRLAGPSLWIQWESALPLAYTPWALASPQRQHDFREFARGIGARFDPDAPGGTAQR